MSTNNSTTTCPSNAVPEPINLGIDNDTLFAVVPRGDYTSGSPDGWMASCCAPNAALLATDNSTGTCWQWCDLPPRFTNGSSGQSGEFLDCVRSAARAANSSYVPSAVLVSAAPGGGAVGENVFGLGVVLVMAVSLLLR